MLILWLLACADPETAPDPGPTLTGVSPSSEAMNGEERALDAYDQAMEARDGEDWRAAVDALILAIERDPMSPSLRLWLAQTYLDAGLSTEARQVLDEAVRQFPENDDCLYNRAALRAREGDISGAADDLRSLNAMGLLDPLETGSDEDFIGLRDDPLYGDLVTLPRISVLATAEEGAVLLGDLWRLDMRIAIPLTGDLEVYWEGPPSDLLQLESVVEQQIRESTHERALDLSVRFRAVRAGRGSLGPWRVRSGAAESWVDARPVEVVDLGTWTQPHGPVTATELPIPGVLQKHMDEQGVAITEPWVAMTVEPGETIRTSPEVPLVYLELRSSGGPVKAARAVVGAEKMERIRGDEVLHSLVVP